MADLTGTSYTGTTWPGSYGPGGSLFYYGGKMFKTPQELYAALGQPYDAGSLPYGTTVYGQGSNSGMSSWDSSVRNNPMGYLDAPTGGTAGIFANASSGMGTPAPTTPPAGTTATTGTPPTDSRTQQGASSESTPTAPPGGAVNPPAGNLIPGAGSTTPADVFDPFDDPRQAVYRALLANGYNPDVPTWGMSQLQKRATDIVTGALGRVAWGGNPDTLSTPGSFQEYINSLVGQAGTGAGGIMPTAGQGRDYLDSVNTIMKGDNRSQGATYLSSLFGADPGAAAGLAGSLRYQGFAPSVRSALQGPLQNYANRFAGFTETPAGFATATTHNALDILLNNLIPGYRPLF